jgi:hypothetical protein
MKHALLLTALLAAAPALLAQNLYRWVDEHGKVHYSDLPPPASVRQAERQRFTPAEADNTPSYLMRKAAEDFPVALYTTVDCGAPCQEAKAFLSGRGIPFSERVLQTEADVTDYRRVFGEPDEVPALTVGRRPTRGFSQAIWQQMLDEAGFPRSGAR